MKKVVILLCVIGIYALPGNAQGVTSSSIRVSTAVEAPESNIDLLKKSLHSSGSPIATVGKPVKKTQKQVQQQTVEQPKPVPQTTPVPAPQPTAQHSSAAETLLAQPASVKVDSNTPVATPQTTPAKAPQADATGTLLPQPVAPVVKPAKTIQKNKISAKNRLGKQKRKPTQTGVKKTTQRPSASSVEQQIEKNNALLPADKQVAQDVTAGETLEEADEEAAADAELEYAVKMLEQSKAQAQAAGRPIPPPAAQNRPNKVPAPNKKFNPNAFRPGVEWLASKSNHFDIYTQKRTAGVPSSNMAMNFEASYQTLRRFIPWMMSGRVRVFVYQDHDSYLRYEPNAKAWTRAVAYPTRGEIVVYDEPGKARELKEVFTHELTHIFTQQFFDSHQTGRIMTPLWLDEGLAVFMEDQAHSNQGGEWAQDFKTLNFQRDPAQDKPAFASSSMFGSGAGKKFSTNRKGKPLFFVPFGKFMDENSLQNAEGSNRVQDWYFQAYTVVRFLLNPAGGVSPSNRMQFEQFTRLIAQGEAVRNPSTGFLMKDSRGKTVYEPYSVEKALGRAYRYNTIENFEDAFWRWAGR
ncbi:MAG: hypothetical protein IKP06_03420 [Elusimicrobiaceae bacterium]|nr:hypothetical protein [Elusimicrobiaceae bacterium]